MKNKKQIAIVIVAIIAIIAIVGGSTFAYFQWTTSANQRTNVNVTIAAGGIQMIMTPEGGVLEANGLKPVADCMESYAYFDTTVSIVNSTGTLAVPSFKLTARVKPNSATGASTLKKADLSHIHYSVVEINAIGQEIKADKADNSGARRCYEPANIDNEGAQKEGLFSSTSNASAIAAGTFTDMEPALTDGWTSAINLPSTDNVYLARQYNNDPQKGDTGAFGITLIGAKASAGAPTTTTKYFRVYVWIDEGYTYTNAGEAVTDPLQNAIIEVTWSTSSIVEQVAD